jgi:HSP20 family protein
MVRRAVDIKTGTEGHFWSDILEPIKQVGRQIMEFVSPNAEASEVADAYEVSVELPGVKTEDIDVTVADGILTVRGEKHSEREEKGRSYYFSERSYGAFQRSFRLPSDADASGISADSEHGVLTIRIPRVPAEKRPETKIKVKTGAAGGKSTVKPAAKSAAKGGKAKAKGTKP